MSIRPLVIFLIVGAILILFVSTNKSMYQVFTPKLSSKIHNTVQNPETLTAPAAPAPATPPAKVYSTTKLEIYDSAKQAPVQNTAVRSETLDSLKKQISAQALKLYLNEIGTAMTSPFEIYKHSLSSSEGPTLDFYGSSIDSDKELIIKFSKFKTVEALRNDFLVGHDLIGSKLVSLNQPSLYTLQKQNRSYIIVSKYPRTGASYLFVLRQNSQLRAGQAEAFYRSVAK